MKQTLWCLALALGGCSGGEDAYRFPPTLAELRAELGTPPRGTMRLRDYDLKKEYESSVFFLVTHNSSSCAIDVVFKMGVEPNLAPVSLGFGSSSGCDLREKLARGPYPTGGGYSGSTQQAGEYTLVNDSTISGVFYVEMKSDGVLLDLTRRVAATFTAKRVATWPAP